MLSPYEDPLTAAELAIHDIECATERLRTAPPEVLSRFRDVCADLADDINQIAKETKRGQH